MDARDDTAGQRQMGRRAEPMHVRALTDKWCRNMTVYQVNREI